MSPNAVNPLLRIAVGPTLLLVLQLQLGAPLAMLAPVFLVLLLTMPVQPPLSLMLKILAVVLLASFFQAFLGQLLERTGPGYWLLLWAVLLWSLSHLHDNAKDLVALLTMITALIVTVVHKQYGQPASGLPLLLGLNFLAAMVAYWLCLLLFPGDQAGIQADAAPDDQEPHQFGHLLVKASAVFLVVWALVGLQNSQSLLIGVTLASVLKDSNPLAGRHNAKQRLVTTAVGILHVLPVLALFLLEAPLWVTAVAAVACALQLASFTISRGCTYTEYQLLFTTYVMLLYQILNPSTAAAFEATLLRLATVLIAVVIGLLVLSSLSASNAGERTPAACRRLQPGRSFRTYLVAGLIRLPALGKKALARICRRQQTRI